MPGDHPLVAGSLTGPYSFAFSARHHTSQLPNMRLLLALSGFVTLTWAQSGSAPAMPAETNIIVPSSVPMAGCLNSRSGTFQIASLNATSNALKERSLRVDGNHDAQTLHSRQDSGAPTLTLTGGILRDQANRTGYIASDYQFQFDALPQDGAIFTGGFSICVNGSLALGASAVFWLCPNGTFYNLYDRRTSDQCNVVNIQVIGGAGGIYNTDPSGPVSTRSDQDVTPSSGGSSTVLTSTSSIPLSSPQRSSLSTSLANASGTRTQPTPTSVDSSPGLSTGVKAGIGVAVPFGVTAIALFVFLFWRRRRKSRANESYPQTHGADSYYEKPELAGGPYDPAISGPVKPRSELPNATTHTIYHPMELADSSSEVPRELPTSN